MSTKNSLRRVGQVEFDDAILRRAIVDGSAAQLFSGAVPLDVQRDWMMQTSTFVLWHPAFDEIEEGEITPDYQAIFTVHEDGQITHTWQRLDLTSEPVTVTGDMWKKMIGGAA